jgi:hypothetical protein
MEDSSALIAPIQFESMTWITSARVVTVGVSSDGLRTEKPLYITNWCDPPAEQFLRNDETLPVTNSEQE